MGRAVRVPFERDGRHRNRREGSKPPLQIVVLRLAFDKPEAPAVVMDHDADVVRVVEGRRAAREGGVVELPLRRCELPNELRNSRRYFS